MTALVRGVGVCAALLAGALLLVGDSTADDAEEAARVVMEPEIRWAPEAPSEGHLFAITVTASTHTPLLGVHGTFAGQELHFERVEGRTFRSLAPMPVGTESSESGAIRVVYDGGGEKTIPVRVPVTPVEYRYEELRVAPRFGSPLSEADRARLRSDQEMAAEAARVAHRTRRIWSGESILPRASIVTSEFGDGRVFNGQVSSRHMGLDLRGARGDTVLATAKGVVALVEPFLLAGDIVYLNHGDGLLSAYFHLSRQLVAVGDTVDAGEPIGLVGSTGRVTGPHLHWVVRYGTVSVDPRSLAEAGRLLVPEGAGR